MNIAETSPREAVSNTVGWSQTDQAAECFPPVADRPLHRIRTVRHQQGISLRTIARGRHVSLRQVRCEESPHSDLNLSTIYHWQHYLDVPVADLLVENQDPLSRPVMERARMVKLMKTIATIRERATSDEVRRLTETLYGQAVEMMPELVDVQPWQRIGQRRTLDELGRVAEHQLPDDLFGQYEG